jgi:hypothetical protein
MTIDQDLIRALLARREGTRLDFKETHYENANSGNAELAKDLSAMANAMPRSASSAYILIGVREKADGTGELIGVAPNSHFDDATLHEKVRHILNRTPDFSYDSAEVDGQSVGVFEIRSGGRPFYPVRDNAVLRRNCAVVRDGSSTDIASPDQILEWASEDDSAAHELRVLQLQQARAKVSPKPAIYPKGRVQLSSGDYLRLSVTVENHGEIGFTILKAISRWTLTDKFVLALTSQESIALASTLAWDVEVEAGQYVPVGGAEVLQARLRINAFTAALIGQGLQMTKAFDPEWLAARFSVTCEATTGVAAVVEETRLWPPDKRTSEPF